MKKSSKLLLISTFVLSSLGFAATAMAKPFGDGSSCGHGDRNMEAGYKGDRGFNVDRMAKKLNLTDEQRTQVKVIMEESKKQMTDQRDKFNANRDQLKELTKQSPLNEAEVRRVADAQGDLKTDMIVLRAQQRAKINALLSEEQRTQLEEMRGKKRGDH